MHRQLWKKYTIVISLQETASDRLYTLGESVHAYSIDLYVYYNYELYNDILVVFSSHYSEGTRQSFTDYTDCE